MRGNPRVRYHSVHYSCRSRQADYMLAKSVDLQDSYLALAVSVTYVAEFWAYCVPYLQYCTYSWGHRPYLGANYWPGSTRIYVLVFSDTFPALATPQLGTLDIFKYVTVQDVLFYRFCHRNTTRSLSHLVLKNLCKLKKLFSHMYKKPLNLFTSLCHM